MTREGWAQVLTIATVAVVVAYLLTESDGTVEADVPSGETGGALNVLYANTVGAIGALVSAQTVGPNGIELIKQQEGCKLAAYYDVNGYSIGYGHHDASAGETCTQGQADAWLADDANAAACAALKFCRVPLTQNQLDALTDWIYNLGASKVKSATLWTVLNSGNYAGVPAQLMRWNMSGGSVNPVLTARRQAEADLWNGGAN